MLVNRCRCEEEGREVFGRLSRAAHRLTGKTPAFLGYLPEDEHLEASFQKGVPITSFSRSAGRRAIRHIASVILAERENPAARDRESFLQLLGEAARAG